MGFDSLFAQAFAELRKQLKEELREELRAELNNASGRDISFSEAMKYLGMSDYSLRQLCKAKKIPHRTVGRDGSKNPRYIFNTASLDRWKREQEKSNYKGAAQ